MTTYNYQSNIGKGDKQSFVTVQTWEKGKYMETLKTEYDAIITLSECGKMIEFKSFSDNSNWNWTGELDSELYNKIIETMKGVVASLKEKLISDGLECEYTICDNIKF